MVATANPVHSPNRHEPKARELTEVVELQRDAFAHAKDPTLTLKERREWTKVYALLSERRRILNNKPLPGSLVHDKVRRTRECRKLASSALVDVAAEHAHSEPASTHEAQAS